MKHHKFKNKLLIILFIVFIGMLLIHIKNSKPFFVSDENSLKCDKTKLLENQNRKYKTFSKYVHPNPRSPRAFGENMDKSTQQNELLNILYG